jgi:hypothetical protein
MIASASGRLGWKGASRSRLPYLTAAAPVQRCTTVRQLCSASVPIICKGLAVHTAYTPLSHMYRHSTQQCTQTLPSFNAPLRKHMGG